MGFDKIGTEYEVVLTKNDVPCKVKVGGSLSKFAPNINMQKWDDEVWLNVNHPDVVNLETETHIDDKISLTIGDQTHKYYSCHASALLPWAFSS